MAEAPRDAPGYRWISAGDLNGFLALSIDNLALLAGMSAILVGVFHLPSSLVIGRMLPGSALGVLVGDLAYSAMAIRLARRTGSTTVCAMPLGIDTPSMFGLCFGVISPAWLATGFIITSMLWSTLLIHIIDANSRRILVVCGLAAVLTLFGVIHSPFSDGRLFLPGAGLSPATFLLAAGYVLLGAVTWSIDRLEPRRR